jgi:predicted dehydrogenase
MKNKLFVVLELIRLALTPRIFAFIIKNAIRHLFGIYRSEKLPSWRRRREDGSSGQKRIRVGIVGAGKFAKNHLKVLNEFSDVEILGLCATGSESSRKVAAEYAIPEYYTDLDQFLVECDVDAVFIILPLLSLWESALKCLQSGKAILVEKPAGFSSDQIQALKTVAEENGCVAMVGYNRRFYSVVQHSLAALADCGPMLSLRAQKNYPVEVLDNWLFAQSSHAIDLFRYILGEVESVSVLSNFQGSDSDVSKGYAASIKFRGNIYGNILGVWDSSPGWRMRIIAERGVIEFDPLEDATFVDSHNRRIVVQKDEVDVLFRQGLYAQNSHFIEAVKNSRKPSMPACTLEDAYKTNKLIEALYG